MSEGERPEEGSKTECFPAATVGIRGREPDDAECTWLQLVEEAVTEWDEGNLGAVERRYREAQRLAQEFDAVDPRRATGINNLAIVMRLRGKHGEAETLYGRAIEAWQGASEWVDRMRVSPRARSSLFHLRLERKHRDTYDELARKTFQRLLFAGPAATWNNLAELCQATGRIEEAEAMCRQALEARVISMGPEEVGATRIRENLESLSRSRARPVDPARRASPDTGTIASFRAQAVRNRWLVDAPPEFTDEGRLMAAILLTQVIGPEMTPTNGK